MKGRRGKVQRATSQDDAFPSECVFSCSHLRARFVHLAPGLAWWRRQIIYLPFSRKEVMWNLRGRRTSVRSDLSELHSQQFNRRLLQDDLWGWGVGKRSFGLRARFRIHPHEEVSFSSLRRRSTTALFFAPAVETNEAGGRVEPRTPRSCESSSSVGAIMGLSYLGSHLSLAVWDFWSCGEARGSPFT